MGKLPEAHQRKRGIDEKATRPSSLAAHEIARLHEQVRPPALAIVIFTQLHVFCFCFETSLRVLCTDSSIISRRQQCHIMFRVEQLACSGVRPGLRTVHLARYRPCRSFGQGSWDSGSCPAVGSSTHDDGIGDVPGSMSRNADYWLAAFSHLSGHNAHSGPQGSTCYVRASRRRAQGDKATQGFGDF